MRKILSFLVVLFSTISLMNPSTILAQQGPNVPFVHPNHPTCESQGLELTVFSPRNSNSDMKNIKIQKNYEVGLRLKIPIEKINNTEYANYKIFPVLLMGFQKMEPGLGSNEELSRNAKDVLDKAQSYDKEIDGKAYRIFEWVFRNPGNNVLNALSNDVDYSVEMKRYLKSDGWSMGDAICDGPEKQITVTQSTLLSVPSCPINISDVFNVNDKITGTVQLTKVSETNYRYLLFYGDVSQSVPKDPVNPGSIPDSKDGKLVNQRTFPDDINVFDKPYTLPAPDKAVPPGKYTAAIYATSGHNEAFACGVRVVEVSESEKTSEPTLGGGTNVDNSLGKGEEKNTQPGVVQFFGCKPGDKNCTRSGGTVCRTSDGKELGGNESIQAEQAGIVTAIGCIPTHPKTLVLKLLTYSASVGGGIALLLMIFGSIRILTSAGSADAMKQGREQFTSAAMGLLFIIFSIFLLKIIGVDLLQIPGFG